MHPQKRSRKYPLNCGPSGAAVIAVMRTRLYMAVLLGIQVIWVDCVVSISWVARAVKST